MKAVTASALLASMTHLAAARTSNKTYIDSQQYQDLITQEK